MSDQTGNGGDPTGGGDPGNRPHRFDRLPGSADDRVVEGRATREAVLDFLADSYGIPASTFDDHTFWERGAGKIWLFHGDLSTPVEVEGLGMAALRTRQEHWKPTLEFAQRFGHAATRSVIHLEEGAAAAFLAGHDQELAWDGDWGYVLVSHDLAGAPEPIGVGLYLHGELRSQVPKGRRRDFLE
jgi:NOL1/NOP2/fmu family ribosome biogenesis protein